VRGPVARHSQMAAGSSSPAQGSATAAVAPQASMDY